MIKSFNPVTQRPVPGSQPQTAEQIVASQQKNIASFVESQGMNAAEELDFLHDMDPGQIADFAASVKVPTDAILSRIIELETLELEAIGEAQENEPLANSFSGPGSQVVGHSIDGAGLPQAGQSISRPAGTGSPMDIQLGLSKGPTGPHADTRVRPETRTPEEIMTRNASEQKDYLNMIASDIGMTASYAEFENSSLKSSQLAEMLGYPVNEIQDSLKVMISDAIARLTEGGLMEDQTDMGMVALALNIDQGEIEELYTEMTARPGAAIDPMLVDLVGARIAANDAAGTSQSLEQIAGDLGLSLENTRAAYTELLDLGRI